MAKSGIELLLAAAGIDPAEIRANIEAFMASMKATAEQVNANQKRIEDKLDLILAAQPPAPTTQHIRENGELTGVLVTEEKFPDEVLKDAGILNGSGG